MPKASTREHGLSGIEISGGQIAHPYLPPEIRNGDYLSDWTIETMQKMLLGDGQVGSVRNAIDLALMQSDYSIIPYKASDKKDPSKEDRDIALFVEKCWEPLWPQILDEALDAIWYGFKLFEPIHRIEDGQIVWDRFAPRMPWTIQKWVPKDGHVDEVEQYGYDVRTDQYKTLSIDGANLLRFTNRQRGENFEGSSYLRPAYKHWLYKDTFYKLVAIFFERWAGCIPVGALPEGVNSETVDEFKKLLSDLRTNEASYLYLGEIASDQSIDNYIKLLTPDISGAGPEKVMEHIHHHDVLIARSMLAQFVNLGETDAGTRALSGDMSDLFLMNLEAISKWIARTVSVGHRGEYEGIKTLVDYNFENVRGYPKLRCGRTKKTDAAQILAVTAQLVQSGALEPDDSLENYLRGLMGAPLEKSNPRPVKNPVTRERNPANNPAKVADKTSEQFVEVEHRQPFRHERFVAFAEIESALDTAEEDVVGAWRDIFRRQLDLLGQEFDGSISRANISKLTRLEMPLQGELASRFETIFKRMYRQGQLSVKGEILRQIGESRPATFAEEDDEWMDEEEALALIAAQADAAAQRLSDKARGVLLGAAIGGLASASFLPWQGIRDKVWLISDAPAQTEATFVNAAYGAGRNETTQHYEHLIEERWYSALLDMNCCEVCIPMDGVRYSEQPFQTPNPNCYGMVYGKAVCRCVTVIELKPGVATADL